MNARWDWPERGLCSFLIDIVTLKTLHYAWEVPCDNQDSQPGTLSHSYLIFRISSERT
jgi:hypothetical protein